MFVFFEFLEFPQNEKKVENFWFHKLLEIIVILSPHMGEKQRHGVAYKSKSEKIEIGLTPPEVSWYSREIKGKYFAFLRRRRQNFSNVVKVMK